MSMAATAGNPIAAGMGISYVSCARPLTRRQQCQTQSRAARRRATPGETEGISLLRKEAGRHLAASNRCERGRNEYRRKKDALMTISSNVRTDPFAL